MPYSARMPRIAPTTCWTRPNSVSASASCARSSGRGHGATEIEASAGRPGNRRQSASVTNGMTGWSSRSATSNVCVATARATSPPGYVAVEPGLDLLDVPVGQVAPEEAIDRGGGLVETELLVGLGGLAHGGVAAGEDPAVGQESALRAGPHRCDPASGRGGAVEVGQDESAGVPQLVGEVPARRERGLEVVRDRG